MSDFWTLFHYFAIGFQGKMEIAVEYCRAELIRAFGY